MKIRVSKLSDVGGKDLGEVTGGTLKKMKLQEPKKELYLGDGVSAEATSYGLVLTTRYAGTVTNRICLDPGVMLALKRFEDAWNSYREALLNS